MLFAFIFRGVAKFTGESGEDELLAYCLAFGIFIGAVLALVLGLIYSSGFIIAMGPTIGIFLGLAAWFILAEEAEYTK